MSFFKTYRTQVIIFILLAAVSIVSGTIAHRAGPTEQSPARIEQTSALPEITQTETVPADEPIQHTEQTDAPPAVVIQPSPLPEPIETLVVLEHPIGTQLIVDGQTLNIAVESGSTIYDVMAAAKEKFSTLTFTTKNYKELGQFIESINGIANDPDKPLYWTLYINNQRSAFGVSNYTVKDGDVILWKFENINNT